VITGTVWTCGDNVTAYQITPQRRWNLNALDPVELGKWAFEDAAEQFKDVPGGFQALGCEIVVAGHDFGGGGKSIEHPIVAMQGAGVKLVLAESFSRYNFRNAINRGLPAIICPGISAAYRTGDRLQADLLTGEITNQVTGQVLQGTPLSDLILRFWEAGGMLSYYRQKLSAQKGSE
jgi:3-isopropylmalate/(R)-2-methylmalate dehydratase small subunit